MEGGRDDSVGNAEIGIEAGLETVGPVFGTGLGVDSWEDFLHDLAVDP